MVSMEVLLSLMVLPAMTSFAPAPAALSGTSIVARLERTGEHAPLTNG